MTIECLYRAISVEFAEKGMLPIWHVQADSASDNKSRWTLGFFAWVIQQGWVREVRTRTRIAHAHAHRATRTRNAHAHPHCTRALRTRTAHPHCASALCHYHCRSDSL